MEESNPKLGDQFKKIVRNQIKYNKPPITKETYHRLLAEGIDEDEVIRLIACVIANEMYTVMKTGKSSSPDDYAKDLKKLPEMPWE